MAKLPPVFGHDTVGDGQTQAGSLTDRLGREEQVENIGCYLRRDAGSIVLDTLGYGSRVAPDLDLHELLRLRGSRQSVPRIAEQVDENLVQSVSVDFQRWQRVGDLLLDANACGLK